MSNGLMKKRCRLKAHLAADTEMVNVIVAMLNNDSQLQKEDFGATRRENN